MKINQKNDYKNQVVFENLAFFILKPGISVKGEHCSAAEFSHLLHLYQ